MPGCYNSGMLIDTHCHLDASEFAADRDQVVARARAAGVEAMVVPAVECGNFAGVLDCCMHFSGCHAALGIHPMYVARALPDDLACLRAAVAQHHPVAIGEIGLDFFVPDFDSALQQHYFVEQLKIARDFDLPVLLHIRRAQDQVLKQLRRFGLKGGIAHAFNGSRQQADEFIKLGFKLGFGGAMTYPRATRLRELAATLPLEAIVNEVRKCSGTQFDPQVVACLLGWDLENLLKELCQPAKTVFPIQVAQEGTV